VNFPSFQQLDILSGLTRSTGTACEQMILAQNNGT
jgi:hypothetical protein